MLPGQPLPNGQPQYPVTVYSTGRPLNYTPPVGGISLLPQTALSYNGLPFSWGQGVTLNIWVYRTNASVSMPGVSDQAGRPPLPGARLPCGQLPRSAPQRVF